MNDNRTRLLRIEQLLDYWTDGDHSLNASQLAEKLFEKYNIETERKALYRDITALTDAGIEIARNPDGFSRIERTFELQELKMIVDVILSSKFLPEADTQSLLEKIKTLCSVYEAQELQRQVVVSNRVKNMNSKVFFSLDALNRAINENRMVSFSYFNYNADKQVQLRNHGKEYRRSPFMLLYEGDCYYCLMYNPRMKRVIPYRVDRMKDVKVVEDSVRDGVEAFAAMDKRMYTQFAFGMFSSGKVVHVDFRCHTNLMNVFIDKFGKEVWTRKIDKDHFTASVPVTVSPPFFGWVCGLGDQVEIIGPAEVKEQFLHHMEKVAGMYRKGED